MSDLTQERTTELLQRVAGLHGTPDLTDPKKGQELIRPILEEFFPGEEAPIRFLRAILQKATNARWAALFGAPPEKIVAMCFEATGGQVTAPPAKQPRKEAPAPTPAPEPAPEPAPVAEDKPKPPKRPRKKADAPVEEAKPAEPEKKVYEIDTSKLNPPAPAPAPEPEPQKTDVLETTVQGEVTVITMNGGADPITVPEKAPTRRKIPRRKKEPVIQVDDEDDDLDMCADEIVTRDDMVALQEQMVELFAQMRNMMQQFYMIQRRLLTDDNFVPPTSLDE